MDRDHFIIQVYCLVCECYATIKNTYAIRRGGFAPALTDEEVITMEICGECFKYATDQDIYAYFRAHYHAWFPTLNERTQFIRQAANLWQVKAAIQKQLTILSGQANDPVQVIDTMPLPVCGYPRSKRDRCVKADADYGYCAAKKLHYYGFKLGLRISRAGMITYYPMFPCRPHDINFLGDLVEGFAGIASADKGFIDAVRQALLEDRHGVVVVTPTKKGMVARFSSSLLTSFRHMRKYVETVGSQLTERFSIDHIRVRDLWHYQHRVIRKILAHTVAVFFNLQAGRPPLHFQDLVID